MIEDTCPSPVRRLWSRDELIALMREVLRAEIDTTSDYGYGGDTVYSTIVRLFIDGEEQ